MKTSLKYLVWLAAFLPLMLNAEPIPVGYYDSIAGKSDSILKTTLSLICRGGVRYEYGTNQYHSTNDPNGQWVAGDLKALGTWQALPLTDRREDGSIWDMYSNSQRYYPAKQGESGCSLNIEHCLPKSWWGGEVNDAYKDLYHLNPSDQRANQQKSNYAPGHVTKGDKFDNGSFRMDSKTKSQYGYICFEPAPEYRGDFARAYFYIATAYEYLTWTAYADYINNNSYLMFSTPIQQVLLDWHREDPVSDKEICRAEQISYIQHNRNPFIDYPELVEYIWGSRKGQAVVMDSLTCTYGTGTCVEYQPVVLPCICYDTLISLPALTAALVNAVPGGSANSGIQSNGTSSITMGKSSTDGEISFSGQNITDSTVLVFRASPYNSATSMQIEIYANDVLIRTITETVVKDTRNELYYTTPIPVGTNTIRILSVGGSTSKRACMQELYLLKVLPEDNPGTSIEASEQAAETPRKIIRDGQLLIVVGNKVYSVLGK